MRIAIIKLSAMGDIIHSMFLLQLIKRELPEVTIDWYVDSTFSELLSHNPHLDKVNSIPLKLFKENKNYLGIIKLLFDLRKHRKYDLVIDMQGLIKSAVVGFFLKKKRVYGFDRKSIKESFASFFYDVKVQLPYDMNILERNLGLVSSALNINLVRQDIRKVNQFIFFLQSKKTVRKLSKYILLIPGASFSSKRYPEEGFIEITKNINSNFVVVFGSEEEKSSAVKIEKYGRNVKKIGNLNLNELKILIFNSSLVIGGDTGPLHMAWAFSIPSIGIFGPTLAKRNFYETKKNKSIQASEEVDSSKINKNSEVIKKIKPFEIVKIANQILNH